MPNTRPTSSHTVRSTLSNWSTSVPVPPIPSEPIPQSFAPPPPATFIDGGALPKLLVFDLDYTLWPFWVDTHVTPPLKAQEGGHRVKDKYGEGFGFYDEVPGILACLRHLKIQIGAASRTQAPDLAREMLKLLKISAETQLPPRANNDVEEVPVKKPGTSSGNRASLFSKKDVTEIRETGRAFDFFDQMQIYPGSKIKHFEKLQKDTGLPYEEMLFFDDESRNKEVERLGVVMWLVRDGVSRDEVDKGVKSWRSRNKRGK